MENMENTKQHTMIKPNSRNRELAQIPVRNETRNIRLAPISIPILRRDSVPGISDIPTPSAPNDAVIPDSSSPCWDSTLAGTVAPRAVRHPKLTHRLLNNKSIRRKRSSILKLLGKQISENTVCG